MTETKAAPAKRAGARKTLNVANLAGLDPERLAALLVEVSDDYPAVKRLLRLELAGEVGAEALAVEVGKRLEVIGQSGARVNWRRYKEFVRDLDMHRRAIAGRLAELDPAAALGLIIRFVALHSGVSDRAKDGKGEIESLFEEAVTDAAAIAPQVRLADEQALVEQLFALLDKGTPGFSVPLLQAVAAALSAGGVSQLRDRVEAALADRRRTSPAFRAAAQILADTQGDVDGYVAHFTPSQLVLPPVGARIARRLLKAGRIAEAKAALERSRPVVSSNPGRAVSARAEDDGEWEAAEIEVLEAEGDSAGAQAARWARFEATLSPAPLRDHLKRLADFDDVVAEEKAIDHVRGHRDLHAALAFFLAWPALDAASELVLERRALLSGQDADLLGAAAKALEGRYPLAATLLLRAAIWDAARYARVERYKDAQRQLLDAESIAPSLGDADLEPHDEFARRVAQLHRW